MGRRSSTVDGQTTNTGSNGFRVTGKSDDKVMSARKGALSRFRGLPYLRDGSKGEGRADALTETSIICPTTTKNATIAVAATAVAKAARQGS
jgi:hypothetical protein